MAKNKKESYLCVSAMVRAREPKLLTDEKAERMLDAPGFEDAAKLLSDCGYPDMSQMKPEEIEHALAERRDGIFAELAKYSPDSRLVDVFRLKYDYHNAKAIIKAEATGQDAAHLLSDAGRIPGKKLLELYNDEKRIEGAEKLGEAMGEAKRALARTSNPQLADFILDKAYFEELKALAEALGSPFIKGYAELLIDSANLKSAVRTRRMGKGEDFLHEVLIPGGTVSTERLATSTEKDSLAALYGHTKLERAAALGGEALSGSPMTEFERACDNAVMAYLKDAKLVGYGCEPILAYMAAVEGEITAVRMMLTGRLAGVAPQVIRERLRDLYA